MAKAKDAFRTISEVAEWLDTPTHVLRFWESKFSQIKPVKGAGGRRYYRPTDMDLLGGIKHLLHEEGMTIKGTQKLLREKGVKHVATLGLSMTATEPAEAAAKPAPPPVKEAEMPSAKDESTVAATAEPPAVVDDGPVQDAFPFDDIPAPATETAEAETKPDAPFEITLPALPDDLPDLPARSFGLIAAAPESIRAHAEQIAPLVQRLAQLRDRMQSH